MNFSKRIKYSLRLLFFLLAAVGLHRFCYKQTDGFTMSKIRSDLGFHEEWAVPALSPSEQSSLHQILSQRFHYLAKGAQCFVFLSEDGNYVLKFFRHHHLRPPSWVEFLPSFWQQARLPSDEKKWGKLEKDFNSYVVAFTELKEQTGLLYLHLNKTKSLQQTATIVDRIGIAHTVALDEMEFMVQRRANLIYPTLAQWIDNHEIDTAKAALSNIVQLLHQRRIKGIFDKDPDLNTNFGFIGEQALQIDIGRFKKMQGDPSNERDELIRITDNLKQWLDQRSEELSHHLLQEISAL